LTPWESPHALNGEKPAGTIVEPEGQDFLVFRRIPPKVERGGIGKFHDDNGFPDYA
jgi:hypothetical protein